MSTTSPLPLEPVHDDDAWKDQVAARLAAHRQKKQRADQQQTLPMEGLPEPRPRQQRRVAEAVASRFAQQQSYRDYLQAEAEAAMQKARAEAEIAARNAAAIAQAQQQLLEELEQWDEPEETVDGAAPAVASAEVVEIPVLEPFTLEPLVQERRTREHGTRAPVIKHPPVVHPPVIVEPEPELEPMVVEYVPEPSSEPIAPLSANLIEFPRQLVASKKARPRLAEGPLREDAPEPPQLRIFEVTAEQIATTPEPACAMPASACAPSPMRTLHAARCAAACWPWRSRWLRWAWATFGLSSTKTAWAGTTASPACTCEPTSCWLLVPSC
ncbi:hypothetical protein AB4043_10730 [Terriglobus sp. YAF25]|uniref:hypothetical protein n=1 Tax=Terriglobus sp. YAF25 TaxID=3233080 RepID=UPI003F961D78